MMRALLIVAAVLLMSGAAGAQTVPKIAAQPYAVQVSAQRTETEVQSSYRALQTKYPAVLGSRDARILRVDLGPQDGVFFSAQVGSFATSEQAAAFCNNLKDAGGHCIVQRPGTAKASNKLGRERAPSSVPWPVMPKDAPDTSISRVLQEDKWREQQLGQGLATIEVGGEVRTVPKWQALQLLKQELARPYVPLMEGAR